MTAVKRICVSWRKKKTHQRSKEYPVYIKKSYKFNGEIHSEQCVE